MTYTTRKVSKLEIYAREITIKAIEMELAAGGLSSLLKQIPEKLRMNFNGWEGVKSEYSESKEIPEASPITSNRLLIAMLNKLERCLRGEIEINGRGWWASHEYTGSAEDYMESEWHDVHTVYITIENIAFRDAFKEAMAMGDRDGYKLKHLAFGKYKDGTPAVQFEKSIIGERYGEWKYAQFEIIIDTNLSRSKRKK